MGSGPVDLLVTNMKQKTLNQYLRERFGQKVYKLALDGGFTCPNRDGTLGTKGCIFCSAGGSGDFAEDKNLSITEQIENGKRRVVAKMPKNKEGTNKDLTNNNATNKETNIDTNKYIAYFQAFTNTYGPVERLRALYTEAINHPDIVAVSIGTRPDCLPDEVIDLLDELNQIKPIWVELGLQTIHEKTANYIRRGYPLSVYDKAVQDLLSRNIEVITHVILGLPGESKEDMLETVKYVGESGVQGIKLQLLHVLKNTDLAKDYEQGMFECMTMDEYISLISDCLDILPKHVIIHRLTGDGPKRILIAPEWSKDKKKVLNALNRNALYK